MGVVADIERQLGRLRAREAADGMPELRTSTMTHIVWCPPAVALAGAGDARRAARAPSGAHDLPDARSRAARRRSTRRVELKDFQLQGMSREVLSEVIELRLRGSARAAPELDRAAAPRLRPARVLPLARRARLGERRARRDRRRVTDRLVVDSSEWRGIPGALRAAGGALRAASPSRTSPSRARFPGGGGSPSSGRAIGAIERLRVEGPRADAELLAGWLRSRLKREISLTRREAATVTAHLGRRRAGRLAGRAAEPERAPLRRARPVRARPGVRGRGAGRRVALPASSW